MKLNLPSVFSTLSTELPIWLLTTSPQSSDLTSQKASHLLTYRFSMTMNLDLLDMKCALSILYAFKMLYLINLYTQGQPPSCSCQPPELADIICSIPTFATTLRLFPNRNNFRDVPHFISTFFKDQQLITSPHDANLDNTRTCHTQTPSHLDPVSLIAFTHSPLACQWIWRTNNWNITHCLPCCPIPNLPNTLPTYSSH